MLMSDPMQHFQGGGMQTAIGRKTASRIVQGNDPFLYGEKVKAYLHAGARQLPGYDIWPNDQVGWGALCVSESLPEK